MRKKSLKKAFIGLTILIFISALSVQSLEAKEEVKEKFEKTIALAKDGNVILSNIAGDIEVTTWDKSEVKIDAVKISRADSKEKAEENLKKVTIEVEKEGDTLTIKTKYHKSKFKKQSLNVSVYFKLIIPEKAEAKINSVSGDITMTEIGGDARAESVSGDVHLERISGSLKARSVSGEVTVVSAEKGASCESVSGDVEAGGVIGDVYMKSVSGDVSGENIKGSVEAGTVSGSIILNGITDADSVEAGTLSGKVKYYGDIDEEGRYYFKSHSGGIVLKIPADSRFDLVAKTFSGGIDSDFKVIVSGKMSSRELKGSVNGGGAEVVAKTFSGGIELIKQ